MGQDPSEIRQEIEETRSRMGETVEAIGYKADVKSRASDYVSEKKDAVVSRVTGTMPDTQEVKHGAKRAVGVAQQNPLGMAIGGAAVGFLAGMLFPSTRLEDEKIGDVAEQVKERARETGQEALERGKQVAGQAVDSAKETAKESGREQAQELASTLREGVQGATGSSGPAASGP